MQMIQEKQENREKQKKQEKKQQRFFSDLTGLRFGSLTVIEPSGRFYCGSPVWRCRCDCGNVVSVWTKYLQNGSATSCPFCQEDIGLEIGSKPGRRSDSGLRSNSERRSKAEQRSKAERNSEAEPRLKSGQSLELNESSRLESSLEMNAFSSLEPNLPSEMDLEIGSGINPEELPKMNRTLCSNATVNPESGLDSETELVFDSQSESDSERKVADYCDRWLAQQKDKVRPTTYQRYRYTIENHIRPAFGGYRLSQLTREQVEDFTGQKLDTLSVNTVRTTLGILRTLLEYIEEEVPGQVPRFRIDYPQEKKSKEKRLSSDDQRNLLRFLTTDMDNCKLGIFLALMTGMVAGELCALRWKDISFTWRQITVANTLRCVNSQEDAANMPGCAEKQSASVKGKKLLKLEPTKRSPDERTIPMTRLNSAYCKRLALANPAEPEAYVLTGTHEPMPPWTLHYRFKKYMDECGLSWVRFDDLHPGFPVSDSNTDFENKELNTILETNLKKVRFAEL